MTYTAENGSSIENEASINDVPASLYLSLGASVAILIISFSLFVSKRTGLKALKTTSRLILGHTSMLLAVAIPEIVGFLKIHAQGNPASSMDILISITLPLVFAFFYIIAVAVSTSERFRDHLQMLKRKYGTAGQSK